MVIPFYLIKVCNLSYDNYLCNYYAKYVIADETYVSVLYCHALNYKISFNDYPLGSGIIYGIHYRTLIYTDLLEAYLRKSAIISVYLRSGWFLVGLPEWMG